MPTVKTDALVLRHAGFGENDRMLTLLTRSLGLVSACAHGCRKATSRLLAASELFTAGEYLLHEKGGRYTLSGFSLKENYYPLRLDYARLSHGVYWLNLCEAVAQPGGDCARLFKMMLLSLAVLAYGETPPRALTAVFLAQLSLLEGFAPRLDVCLRCGRPLRAPMRFDVKNGGACCAACAPQSPELPEDVLAWLREAQAKGAFVLAGRREIPQPDHPQAAESAFALMRAHVEARVEKNMASAKLL